MDREQGIGLLLALVFIVAFGMVLHELGDSAPQANAGEKVVTRDYYHPMATPQKAMPIGPIGTLPRNARDRVAPLSDEMTLESLRRGMSRSAATIQRAPTVRRDVVRPSASTETYYTVKRNDSLGTIARAVYGEANAGLYMQIYRANREAIRGGVLVAGTRLLIPPLPTGRTVSARSRTDRDVNEVRNFVSSRARHTVRYDTHIVKAGETMTKIARDRYNGDEGAVDKIMAANRNLDNANLIQPGMSLRIPR
ncbi:MAG: LysM peptidoglycan-binding domain-containing protein [Phycisphaerales bacterium]|jgi:LysM repeat protein|nr:LysM peptidoglycan-binding domain-containing protein [Phycisphaerales bacterium]MBT7170976.1 LysM peptidoglycan-binding domain-containing protein [Phycisphaerales bacterium]